MKNFVFNVVDWKGNLLGQHKITCIDGEQEEMAESIAQTLYHGLVDRLRTVA